MANEDAIVRIGNKGTIVEVTMQELVGSTLGALNLSTTNAQQVEFTRRYAKASHFKPSYQRHPLASFLSPTFNFTQLALDQQATLLTCL